MAKTIVQDAELFEGVRVPQNFGVNENLWYHSAKNTRDKDNLELRISRHIEPFYVDDFHFV